MGGIIEIRRLRMQRELGGARRSPRVATRGPAAGRAKKSGLPPRKPGRPDLLTGPVHPFGSLAALSVPPSGRLRAHSFASPPRGGFAFIEDGRFMTALESNGCRTQPPVTLQT